jgi:hypothetical protein
MVTVTDPDTGAGISLTGLLSHPFGISSVSTQLARIMFTPGQP